MRCWDFDDLSAADPAGRVQGGTLKYDTSTFWSGTRSLVASANVTGGAGNWAHLRHPIAGAPKTLTFDQHLRVDAQPETELGQITFDGADKYYALYYVLANGNLLAREGTFISNGTAIDVVDHDLGTIPTSTWVRTTIHLELENFPGPNAKRLLVISIDGTKTIERTDVAGLDTIQPMQTQIDVGLTWANKGADGPRKVNVDDAIITWTN